MITYNELLEFFIENNITLNESLVSKLKEKSISRKAEKESSKLPDELKFDAQDYPYGEYIDKLISGVKYLDDNGEPFKKIADYIINGYNKSIDMVIDNIRLSRLTNNFKYNKCMYKLSEPINKFCSEKQKNNIKSKIGSDIKQIFSTKIDNQKNNIDVDMIMNDFAEDLQNLKRSIE